MLRGGKEKMPDRFEKMYGAILLFIVAALVLGSILYGPEMWGVKALIGAVLLAFSIFFAWDYLRESGVLKGSNDKEER